MVYIYIRSQRMRRDQFRMARPIGTVAGDTTQDALIRAILTMDPFQAF